MVGSNVLIVGAGAMARAYADVLVALDRPFVVAGRGRGSADAFERHTGVRPGEGTLRDQLSRLDPVPDHAIVAVSATALATATREVVEAGVRNVLVEKPAGLSAEEVGGVLAASERAGARVFVAYNRRFYSSVNAARSMIEEDGGALSVKFDFTEATRRIEALDKEPSELAGWFFGNSTHVIDLAFFLGGRPSELHADSWGGLDWHPSGAVFTGHGRTVSDAHFSYHANWLSPGRWGVEVMTARRRLILQPMEQLFVQEHSGFSVENVSLDDDIDRTYKPGLHDQVKAFLSSHDDDRLLDLTDHSRSFEYYGVIRDGGHYRHESS